MPARSTSRSDLTPSTDNDAHHQPTVSPAKRSRKGITAEEPEIKEDDFKPDISASDEEDTKPSLAKRSKAIPKSNISSSSSSSSSSNPKKAKAGNGSPGKAKPIAYSPDEDWILFEHARPKNPSINWNEIAQVVGRDPKSCKNRWFNMNKKIETAIKGIGGA